MEIPVPARKRPSHMPSIIDESFGVALEKRPELITRLVKTKQHTDTHTHTRKHSRTHARTQTHTLTHTTSKNSSWQKVPKQYFRASETRFSGVPMRMQRFLEIYKKLDSVSSLKCFKRLVLKSFCDDEQHKKKK